MNTRNYKPLTNFLSSLSYLSFEPITLALINRAFFFVQLVSRLRGRCSKKKKKQRSWLLHKGGAPFVCVYAFETEISFDILHAEYSEVV